MDNEMHPAPGVGETLKLQPELVQIGWWNPKRTPEFYVYGGGPGDVPVFVEKKLYKRG